MNYILRLSIDSIALQSAELINKEKRNERNVKSELNQDVSGMNEYTEIKYRNKLGISLKIGWNEIDNNTGL